MKFMKLGSKKDSFQTDGNDVRYVAAELATDIIINVGDVKFYLHKFPLLSKSARLQKLVATTNNENEEIIISDIPGGSAAFEICAKFCYGMKVTLNAYNVVAARCAAEYLEMQETVEKGNLVYKIDVFLNSSLLRSWKDSIIVLQTTQSFLPWPEDLKVVCRCINSIASNASIDPSKVEWSYTYNRRKQLLSENGIEPQWNGVKQQQTVPKDWWVEDLCELEIDFFKRVMQTIKIKGMVSSDVIGEALKAYALKRMPSFSKSSTESVDFLKYQSLVETTVCLLPIESGSVPCSFLLKLLKAAILLDSGEKAKRELVRRIGRQLEEASVADLLLPAPAGEITLYDVDVIQSTVEEFAMQEQGIISDQQLGKEELQEIRSPAFISDASKLSVAKLVDGYLAEISRDRNLPLSKFTALAGLVSGFPRPVHDKLYHAIDMYLKGHPMMSKSQRKKICRLMNCKKLSVNASMHAVQNERLPVRVVIQVLFFEQIRASKSSNGAVKPDLPGHLRNLLPLENGGSHESSRTATTNTEEDWDSVPTIEELKILKEDLASLKLGSRRSLKNDDKNRNSLEKAAAVKVRGLLATKKMFTKLWSSKGQDENSSTDTSGSPGSAIKEEANAKLTPFRNRRYSVS